MAWEVILPLAASFLQGAIGSGIQANQAARENERNRLVMQMRRSELQPIIDRLRKARDYFGVDEQFVRDFSRASDQANQQAAQSGMTNAGRGGLDQVQGDLLASGLAELARFKTQDDMQREQMLAQILSDPTLYGGQLPPENVGAQTAWGALGGGVAGLGSALNSFISTDEGMAALAGLFTPETVALEAPKPKLGVTPMALPTPDVSITTRNPTGQQGGMNLFPGVSTDVYTGGPRVRTNGPLSPYYTPR